MSSTEERTPIDIAGDVLQACCFLEEALHPPGRCGGNNISEDGARGLAVIVRYIRHDAGLVWDHLVHQEGVTAPTGA